MIRFARHVTDDRLLECYYAERTGDPVDPRVAEHLGDCPRCSARYADVVRVLDEVRVEGTSDADAVFTADRSRAQRLSIARRIEHAGRSARVISFPSHGSASIRATTMRVAPRWIAAAAAAGLFVGVAVGASYEWQLHARMTDTFVDGSRLTPVATRGSGLADVAADDAFLTELDAALARPRTRALVAYDALTPHVREVKNDQ